MDRTPPSNTKLIGLSLFTAFSIVCVGIFGDKNFTSYLWVDSPYGITAAATVPATTAATTQQKCIQLKQGQSDASVDTPCIDGCHYIVTPGNFPSHASLKATSEYSDGSKNPGTVQFTLFGQGGTKTLYCKAGSAGTLGDAAGTGASAGYTVGGVVGTGANSLNVEQSAPASTPSTNLNANYQPGSVTSQKLPDLTSQANGFYTDSSGALTNPCNLVEAGYTTDPGHPCTQAGVTALTGPDVPPSILPQNVPAGYYDQPVSNFGGTENGFIAAGGQQVNVDSAPSVGGVANVSGNTALPASWNFNLNGDSNITGSAGEIPNPNTNGDSNIIPGTAGEIQPLPPSLNYNENGDSNITGSAGEIPNPSTNGDSNIVPGTGGEVLNPANYGDTNITPGYNARPSAAATSQNSNAHVYVSDIQIIPPCYSSLLSFLNTFIPCASGPQ